MVFRRILQMIKFGLEKRLHHAKEKNIHKYRDGYIEEIKGRRKGEGKSTHFFKEGLKDVFPDMSLPEDELVTAVIYENVRNGLYHAGGTRRMSCCLMKPPTQ